MEFSVLIESLIKDEAVCVVSVDSVRIPRALSMKLGPVWNPEGSSKLRDTMNDVGFHFRIGLTAVVELWEPW